MNRHARRHMLGLLCDNYILVATVPHHTRLTYATETFLRTAGVTGWFVVKPGEVPRQVRAKRGMRT